MDYKVIRHPFNWCVGILRTYGAYLILGIFNMPTNNLIMFITLFFALL